MKSFIKVLRWIGVVVLPVAAGWAAMMVFPILWDDVIWLFGGDGTGTPVWFDLGLIGAVGGVAEILTALLVAPSRKRRVVLVWAALASVNAVRGFIGQGSFDGLSMPIGISIGAILTTAICCMKLKEG